MCLLYIIDAYDCGMKGIFDAPGSAQKEKNLIVSYKYVYYADAMCIRIFTILIIL